MSAPSEPLLTNPIPRIAPVAQAHRVEVIDVLRGFALLGILFVDIGDYLREATTFADRTAGWLIRFFVDGSFYPLFSFLFGWGLATQMIRTEGRGIRFVPLYMRRLVVLLLIGFTQVLFLEGSVLHDYATLGFVLLLFRRASSSGLAVT